MEICTLCQDETILLSNSSDEIQITPQNNDETILLSSDWVNQSTEQVEQVTHQEVKKSDSTDETELLNETRIHKSINKTIQLNNVLFDRYEITSVLGKGGMGTVYLAKDLRLSGKYWAIKEVYLEENQLEEFASEAKMLVELDHPNLPKIIDYFTKDTGQTYLVMDYIKGQSLADMYEEKKYELPYAKVIKYSIQVCNLLDYLHAHKPTPIVYRDLKPSNIMIDEKDNVQLIDFGIARKFQEGKDADTVNIGTMGFAAPEQFESNRQTDHRTDLYSLGATMYYLLSEGRYYISTQKPLREINTSLPEELYEIIHYFLQNEPSNRYQSAKEAKNDLMNLKITSKLAKEKKEKSAPLKRKLKLIVYSIVFLAIVAGALYGSYRYIAYTESEEKLVEKFETAIVEKDYATLMSILTTSDQRLSLIEDTLQPFLKYFEQNPKVLSSSMKQLEQDQEMITTEEETILKVVEGDKKYYIVPTYQIEIYSSFVSVQTDRKNANIYVNGEEVAVADSDNYTKNIGPLVPGNYEIEVVWESELVTLNDKRTVELFNSTVEEQVIEFNLTGEMIGLNANYPDAKLFVNGKDSGITIAEASSFGPVLTDGTLKVHAEKDFGWGVVKSPEVKIEGNDSIYLTIDVLTDELKTALMEVGLNYAKSVVEAYQKNDLSVIHQATAAQVEHHQYRLEEIHLFENEITPKKVLFDLDSFDYYENNANEIEVSLNYNVQYDIASIVADETPEISHQEIIEKITLKYNKDETVWKITSVMPSATFNTFNVKEFDLTAVQ